MIKVEGVGKTFKQRDAAIFTAIENVSFTVEKGEFVSIVGPSGCGKTTLLNLVAGLEKAETGSIEAIGRKVTAPGPDRIVVFQEHALFPWLTVLDNVAFGLKQRGLSKQERYDLAMEQIRMVHLGKFADRYPHELSGGMKQRVAIARALVKRPGLLLLDEPLSSLDANLRGNMREEIRRLQKELGITTIMVTHDQEEALSMSDKIAVMNAGELQQIGTPLQLYNAPANWFVANFLGMPAMNELMCSWSADGCLQIADTGQTIPVNGGSGLSALHQGQQMRLAFRPHQVSLITATGQFRETDLRGRVASVEFNGRERLVHIRIGDTAIKVYADMAESLDEHQEIAIRLDADYYLFDRESGENLRLPAAGGQPKISETGDMPFVKQAAYSL
ncbi:ABC transporter ATP-binding protein [Paenibacillus sepulcri]|uniref:ABC transporter ATP-binding protein n=1 Tax=Paenibacillus sepulcri TaxID=359917 RepID=A0ABS7C5U7_9BACL|nr:ABC transporter ATP-binding protein [Paenibacillus sepulcri]